MNTPRILIVDDDRQLLELCNEVLSRKNYRVTSFSTVDDAVKNISSNSYDVAIIDIHFQGNSDGFNIIDEIRKYNFATQIIVITGFGDMETAKQAFRRGVADFIEKSGNFVMNDLPESVKECLKKKKELERRRGNPFVNHSSGKSKVFGGLSEQLDFFETKVDQSIYSRTAQHFVVTGQNCMGKTALLYEFKRLARKSGHLATYIPMIRIGNHSGSTIDIMEMLFHGIYSNLPQSTKKLTNFFDYISSFGVSVLGSGINFSRFNNQQSNHHLFISQTLEKLWEDLKEENRLLILLIDDVDYLIDTHPDTLIIIKQALSSLDYEKTKILSILSCSEKKWAIFATKDEYRSIGTYFLAKITTRRLTKEETKLWIEISTRETGVYFKPEVIDLVWKYTNGHPFMLQVLCYNLFESQLNGIIDQSLWQKSYTKSMIDVGNAIYKGILESLIEHERNIIRCFTGKHDALDDKEIKKCLVDIDPDTNMSLVNNLLESLIEKQLLIRTFEDKLSFTSLMLKDYCGDKYLSCRCTL